MGDGRPKGKRKTTRVRKGRKAFPKVVAEFAEKTAKVMVTNKMSTARYVFDGAVGRSMILVTIDPTVTAAIINLLENMKVQVEEGGAEQPPPRADGGVAGVALNLQPNQE